jgi:hypothetical protein
MMNAHAVVTFLRYWAGDESTPTRRAISATMLLLAGLGLWIVVVTPVAGDWPGVVFAASAVLVSGMVAAAWRMLPIGYLTVVLIACAITLGEVAWYGPTEWELRNADHWQGDMSVTMKVLGQLIENAMFPLLFMLPILALGVLIGIGIRRGRTRHTRQIPLET